MKKFSFIISLLLLGLLVSCATQSMAGDTGLRPLSTNEEIIGRVRVIFTAPGDSTRWHINNVAYSMLLSAVFDGDFPFGSDVRDITWSRISGSIWGGRAQFVAYGVVISSGR